MYFLIILCPNFSFAYINYQRFKTASSHAHVDQLKHGTLQNLFNTDRVGSGRNGQCTGDHRSAEQRSHWSQRGLCAGQAMSAVYTKLQTDVETSLNPKKQGNVFETIFIFHLAIHMPLRELWAPRAQGVVTRTPRDHWT
jgi:hypothetical protein